MSLHVPNKLNTGEKETWMIAAIENVQKRYTLPSLIHMDMNAKMKDLKLMVRYLEVKGWNKFQDKEYSWRKGSTTANNDIILWKWQDAKWLNLVRMDSFETSYSDHKAFKI